MLTSTAVSAAAAEDTRGMSADMSDLIYGRLEDEWDVLANACEEFLLERAR